MLLMKHGIIKFCALLALGAALLAIIAEIPDDEARGRYIYAQSEEERRELITAQGVTDFTLISVSDIIIPEPEGKIFGKYVALQRLQELPLEYFSGKAATIYTYDAPDFLSIKNCRIELMVCEGRLAAAGVYEYFAGADYQPLFRQNIPESD